MNREERQQIIDAEHLDLLGLFHYITGGLAIVFSALFGLQYAVIRLIMNTPELQAAMEKPDAATAETVFAVMQAFFAFFIGFAIVYGVLLIVSGRCLRTRRRRLFSFLVAIPMLLLIPWGTILGVFTLVVLERASVKERYAETAT